MPTDTLVRHRKLLLERTQYGREEWEDAVFALLVQSLEGSASEDASVFLISPHHWGGRPEESSGRRDRIRSLLLAKLREHSEDPTAVRNYCLFLRDEDAAHALQLAEERLVTLAPLDPKTYDLISWLRKRRLTDLTGPERTSELGKLYQSLRREVELRGDDLVVLNFTGLELARIAYELNLRAEATQVANRCIDAYHRLVGRPPQESVQSTTFYAAHILLGELALDQGNFEEARDHLLASVDLPPEESWGIQYVYAGFGLAQRLVTLGARHAVQEYVTKLRRSCSRCDVGFVEHFSETLAEDHKDSPA